MFIKCLVFSILLTCTFTLGVCYSSVFKKEKISGAFIIFSESDEDGTACGIKLYEPIDDDAKIIRFEVIKR